jgi:hypothetical protein
MSNQAMLRRRYRQRSVESWKKLGLRRQKRIIRMLSQPGFGMGMGVKTLIHNGRKP